MPECETKQTSWYVSSDIFHKSCCLTLLIATGPPAAVPVPPVTVTAESRNASVARTVHASQASASAEHSSLDYCTTPRLNS
ncbi:hypothetical protein FRC03_001566 [Tulasnella sp. 419]|nr:hypothetical protein FRC03_001566 [Tulasnella sp. 419]